tara:strand:- start:57 stop:248 length:192 start_codon:yes stop_codon:yes gene_type:complete
MSKVFNGFVTLTFEVESGGADSDDAEEKMLSEVARLYSTAWKDACNFEVHDVERQTHFDWSAN